MVQGIPEKIRGTAGVNFSYMVSEIDGKEK
jgi:hypothetical protein